MQRKLNRLRFAAFLILIIIPAILIAGVLTGDRNYGITSTIIVLLSMLPFFMIFEKKKPKLSELVILSVMCTLAVTGRVAFGFIPQFKPILAIIIITSLSFGPESGFLCGSISMLLSNFMFGQGPWTPWQMFCCGIIGFTAGLLRNKKFMRNKIGLCIFGILSGYLYGAIVDIWTIIGYTQQSPVSIAAIYISAFGFNTVLGIATAFFLFILEKPMTEKLNRIKIKYGLIEN